MNEMKDNEYDDINRILSSIYGQKQGQDAFRRILRLIASFAPGSKRETDYFNESDVILITYGDSLEQKDRSPVTVLHQFAADYLKNIFSTIHILPFFPYSSDDGFSVVDYFQVNPVIGTWEDIQQIQQNFKLMFDLVLNHISAESQWFQSYLNEEQGYQDLAIEIDPSEDLSLVTRPRSLPLLTEKKKSNGKIVHVWTTFSSDQIDLNYRSPEVLEKMVQVLMCYAQKGAAILRLDAVAYLWKEIGTRCIHLPQTHDMVKLFRAILNRIAPETLIVTETNVPHEENISYFGDGKNEAQMVYNFTLPPLLLHTLLKGDAVKLSKWAKTLDSISTDTTFFNFTASHDGIGVRPLEGILTTEEIDDLIRSVVSNGGHVSYKKNPDGSESPYELNITYLDALKAPLEDMDVYHIQRFIASQAIAMVMPGVPGVYIHSLLGTPNWLEGVLNTRRFRTINRKKLQYDQVITKLKDPETSCFRIFSAYIELIKIRVLQPAFHPNSGVAVHDVDFRVFLIERRCRNQVIVAVTNVSNMPVMLSLSEYYTPAQMEDLISGKWFDTGSIRLNPYQVLWLTRHVS